MLITCLKRLKPIGFAFCVAILLPGCMQVTVHVKLNEDGSATVTEKIAFTEQLLDLAASDPAAANFSKSLSKEAALERLKMMGEGAQLASHTLGETIVRGTLFKESITVYTLPNIANLRLVPFFRDMSAASKDPKSCLKFILEPVYDGEQGKIPGMMLLKWQWSDGGNSPTSPPRPSLTPKQKQDLRTLLPLYRELLKDACFKLEVESYNTLFVFKHGLWMRYVTDRRTRAPSPVFELFNFSGDNENLFHEALRSDEEAMIAILRCDWEGPAIFPLFYDRTRDNPFRINERLPLCYKSIGETPYTGLMFNPSPFHYKKHFEGRQFDPKYDSFRSQLKDAEELPAKPSAESTHK
jgi:hypothetical protein